MKIIITSGGTREHIDNVRTLSNTSSGRLGQLCAEAFAQSGYDVIYIHGVHAYIPNGDILKIPVEGVLDLEREMKAALMDPDVVGVIHAMAVSDYFVSSVSNFEQLANHIENKTKKDVVHILNTFEEHGFDRVHKIGSNESGLAVLLKPAPKIIPMIKDLRSDVILVGFKLLVDVSETELIDVGYKLLMKNHCDFVLANDLVNIKGDNHIGHLIQDDHTYKTFQTKQAIAAGLVAKISERVK
ncbi:hypothetical protein AOC36_10025 [Erysipelothrix larvae]|uniref:DNA/pantothenate metabolism flavoprotein C-terminal domain-containing protein n=1 Tax=Erysipelothrix larvae TaxID=1514105 RepID=A0A0X8H1H5_9FIRM|nr:phosphopantothenoylcysteine decarboxylase [Erysipelothrix larvae]AMC94296.1 hypothetical protein AOC36_10025 [Erysipelothrix larvae]